MAEYDSNLLPNLQENLERISLDNITSVTLNTDALRENFTAIVDILKGLVKRVDNNQGHSDQANKDIKDLRDRIEKLDDRQTNDKKDLNEKIFNNQEHIKDLQKQSDNNQKELEKLLEALKELRSDHNDLKNTVDHNQKDLNKVQDTVKDHDKQIQELFDKIGSAGNNNNNNASQDHNENNNSRKNSNENNNNNALNEALQNDLNNLRQDMDDMKKNLEQQIADLYKLLDDFVKKDEFNSYKDQTNNQIQSHQDSIDDLYSKIRELESKLGDKLNCENFDEHIADYNYIKSIVIGLANSKSEGGAENVVPQIIQQQAGPALSTKDSNLLKELGQKFPALEDLVKKLQKDLNDHLLNYKTFSDDATRKIINGEENHKHLKSEVLTFKTETNIFKSDTNKKLNESDKRITELELAIRSIKDQLAILSSLPRGDGSNQGSSGSSADVQILQLTLNKLIERVTNVEGEVSDLQKLKEKVNNIQNSVSDHNKRIGNIEDELAELRALKAKIELLEQLLRDGKAKASRGSSFEHAGGVGGGVSVEQVKAMIDEEINKLRDEIMALLEALKAALDKKAEAEDLWKSEAALLEKLDQIAGALMKRAQSDKNDTKKALMFLEKKIKEITVIIFGGPVQGEEGAIFAKKPWTPWSCASCDSKLKDYPGALIDHKHWNKLPQRETSPGRMTQGKFGKGWSRWADTKRNTMDKFTAGSNKNAGDTLPEINPQGVRVPMDSSRGNE